MKTSRRMSVLQIEQYLIKTVPPGLSTTMIYNHIRKAGLKFDEKRRVDLEEFLEAYMKHKAADPKTGKPPGLEPGQDPNRYKVVLQCLILKNDLDKRRGDVISKSEHTEQLLKLAGIVKRTLEHLPKDIAAMCSDVALVKTMQGKIDGILNALSAACEAENI